MRVSLLLLRIAPSVGVGADELAMAAQVSPDSDALSYEDGVRLWSCLEDLTDDPFIGLTAGEQYRLDTLGMFGLAFATARDFADGLRVAGLALPLLLQEAKMGVSSDVTGSGIEYSMPRLGLRHGVDYMFAAFLTLARECLDGPLVPAAVALQMPAPGDTSRYRSVFGVEPEFSAPRCRLWFDRKELGRPLRGAEPATSSTLLSHAERLLATPPPAERITKVEAALLRSLDQGMGTLQHVADLLETSPRTLQRELRAGGVTFSSLRSSTVETEARRAIRAGVPIDELAKRLGYATRRSFDRAFTRWAGESPAKFRERNLGQ